MVVCVSPDLLARERIFSADVSGGCVWFFNGSRCGLLGEDLPE